MFKTTFVITQLEPRKKIMNSKSVPVCKGMANIIAFKILINKASKYKQFNHTHSGYASKTIPTVGIASARIFRGSSNINQFSASFQDILKACLSSK